MKPIQVHPVSVLVGVAAVVLLVSLTGMKQVTTGTAFKAPAPLLPGLTAEEKEILGHMSIVFLDDGSGNPVNKTIRISGVNVQVVNGSGATGGLVDGMGNLIVGYNELRTSGNDRTGSHNLVVGLEHDFSSYGGFVTGFRNTISNRTASVSGGEFNTASGVSSSVSGGTINRANGPFSSVSGGADNVASNSGSSVSGGRYNAAGNIFSSISAGRSNTTSGRYSSVSGGEYNTASGFYCSVSGGQRNTASAAFSSVSGGHSNTASANNASVSGGYGRTASGIDDWVAGSLLEDQ